MALWSREGCIPMSSARNGFDGLLCQGCCYRGDTCHTHSRAACQAHQYSVTPLKTGQLDEEPGCCPRTGERGKFSKNPDPSHGAVTLPAPQTHGTNTADGFWFIIALPSSATHLSVLPLPFSLVSSFCRMRLVDSNCSGL